jgi:hypothetical protein
VQRKNELLQERGRPPYDVIRDEGAIINGFEIFIFGKDNRRKASMRLLLKQVGSKVEHKDLSPSFKLERTTKRA